MESLDDLIDRERRKVALLEAKLADAKAYLAALVKTQSKARDRIDDLLDEELDKESGASKRIPMQATARLASNRPRSRRITPKWVELLQYIGTEGKTLSQLEDYASLNGLEANNSALRSGLMVFRKNDGYVVTPSKGFYRLTPAGVQAVQDQEAYKEVGLGI